MKPFTTKTGKVIVYDAKKLYVYGINKLSARDYSRKALRDKMNRFQSDLSVVNEVLDKLEAQNYLSDIRKAKSILSQYKDREAISKIKFRMFKAGLSADDIKNCMEEYVDEIKDLETGDELGNSETMKALDLIERRFRIFDPDKKLKIQRFLVSKSFKFDDINKAMRLFSEKTKD